MNFYVIFGRVGVRDPFFFTKYGFSLIYQKFRTDITGILWIRNDRLFLKLWELFWSFGRKSLKYMTTF